MRVLSRVLACLALVTMAAAAGASPSGPPASQGLAAQAQAATNLRYRGVPKFCAAGDSQIFLATGTSATGKTWATSSALSWVRWALGDRVYLDMSNIFALSGQQVTYFRDTEVPQAIAAKCDILYVQVGSADTNIGTDAETVTYPAMYQALKKTAAAGITTILTSITPQDSWTTTQRSQMAELNQRYMLLSFDPSLRTKFIDTSAAFVDYGTGKAKAGYLEALGIHPTTIGAYVRASAEIPTIEALLGGPAGNVNIIDANDTYDATVRPLGNLAQNPLLTGTAGIIGGNVTGTCATNWNCGLSVSSGTTLTAAWSKGTDATYPTLPAQIVTLGGTGDNAYARLQQAFTNLPTGLTAGMKVHFQCKVKWTGGGTLAQIGAYMQVSDGTTIYTVQDGNGVSINSGNYVPGPFPDTGSATVRTPDLLIPSTPTGIRAQLNVAPVSGATVNATVTIEQCEERRAGLGTATSR